MATILDSIVPSRRREKRRVLALEERLNARWGDMSISAPTEGSWNTYTAERVDRGDHPILFSPLSPVTEVLQDTSSEDVMTDSVAEREGQFEADLPKDPERQQASLTLTIPLPWKKSHSRTASNPADLSRSKGQQKETAAAPVSRSVAASPTVVYKPASEGYRKELDRSLGSATTSPAVHYKPVSDEYKKALDNLGSRSTRPLTLAPYESVPKEEDRRATSSGPAVISSSETEGTASDAYESASVASSGPPRSETAASTPPTDHGISDEVIQGMAELGFSASPSLRQGARDARTTSLGSQPSNAYRDSTSSCSSGDSASSGFQSPRGLGMATMSTGGGGYYASLVQDYKAIAKTVEDDAVAQYKRKKLAKATLEQQKRDEVRNLSTLLGDGHATMVETRKPQPEMVDRARYNRRDTGRAQSADRHRRLSVDRPSVLSKDRRRGVSVGASRPQAESRERRGPQELVPQCEDLWG